MEDVGACGKVRRDSNASAQFALVCYDGARDIILRCLTKTINPSPGPYGDAG
jgi:hypothetical protein